MEESKFKKIKKASKSLAIHQKKINNAIELLRKEGYYVLTAYEHQCLSQSH